MDEMKAETQDSEEKYAQHDHLIQEVKLATSAEERQTKIQNYIQVVLKETLSLPTTDQVDIDQNFADFGVDSLMALEMKNRFQALLPDKTLSIPGGSDSAENVTN